MSALNQLFEDALGVAGPLDVMGVELNAENRTLTILIRH